MPLSKDLRELVEGQRITKVLLNRFWDNKVEQWVHNPTIHLSNGVVIHFGVQETELGEYGVTPIIDTIDLKAKKVKHGKRPQSIAQEV